VKVLSDTLPMVNSAFRFAPDFPAFKDRELKPLGTITDAFAQAPHPKRPPGDRLQGQGGRGGQRRGDNTDNRPPQDDQRGGNRSQP